MGTILAEPKTIQKGWLALHAVGVMVTLRLVLTRLKLPDLMQRTRSKGVDHGVGCPVALVF